MGESGRLKRLKAAIGEGPTAADQLEAVLRLIASGRALDLADGLVPPDDDEREAACPITRDPGLAE